MIRQKTLSNPILRIQIRKIFAEVKGCSKYSISRLTISGQCIFHRVFTKTNYPKQVFALKKKKNLRQFNKKNTEEYKFNHKNVMSNSIYTKFFIPCPWKKSNKGGKFRIKHHNIVFTSSTIRATGSVYIAVLLYFWLFHKEYVGMSRISGLSYIRHQAGHQIQYPILIPDIRYQTGILPDI